MKGNNRAIAVGVGTAFGGLAALGGMFYYIIAGDGDVVKRVETLGMLALAVGIAFAVAAMLRFALAPLIAPQSAPTVADDAATRGLLGRNVLLIGSIAIVVLAAALIVAFALLAYLQIGQLGNKIDTLLMSVFTTVIPLIATWVGTVLAFYFGTENFRQAAESTREALQFAPKKKITDVMIPYERIARLYAENEDDAETKLTIWDVIHTLSGAARRVIVFNAKTQTPIYVIRSTSPPMPANWVTPDYEAGTALKTKDAGKTDQDKTKLKEYLEVSGNKVDAKKFRWIDENATPEAALALMTKEGVDDLFITKDGQKESPVLGWVTTNDLIKK
jgi:hypothetical protein